MFWFGLIIGCSTYIIAAQSAANYASRCYECNYAPSGYVKGSGLMGWEHPRKMSGHPKCSLTNYGDLLYVDQWKCDSGVCFIRRESSGLIYRGCANPDGLPWNVDIHKNCHYQGEQKALWYFCKGDLCNEGQLGENSIKCGSPPPAQLVAQQNKLRIVERKRFSDDIKLNDDVILDDDTGSDDTGKDKKSGKDDTVLEDGGYQGQEQGGGGYGHKKKEYGHETYYKDGYGGKGYKKSNYYYTTYGGSGHKSGGQGGNGNGGKGGYGKSGGNSGGYGNSGGTSGGYGNSGGTSGGYGNSGGTSGGYGNSGGTSGGYGNSGGNSGGNGHAGGQGGYGKKHDYGIKTYHYQGYSHSGGGYGNGGQNGGGYGNSGGYGSHGGGEYRHSTYSGHGHNPCDGKCYKNPSGLYSDKYRKDHYIQCGCGYSNGHPCVCCRPFYMKCAYGTIYNDYYKTCSFNFLLG